jgi:hypothetical protein
MYHTNMKDTPVPRWAKVGSLVVLGLFVIAVGHQTYVYNRTKPATEVRDEVRKGSPGASIPLTTALKRDWPTLTVAAHGKEYLPDFPDKTAIVTDGNNYLVYTVLRGGRECVFGADCDGDIVAAYVLNLSDKENVISYALRK